MEKYAYQPQTWFHRLESLTLTKGTSGNLNTGGNTNFGVTGGDRVNLTELLEVLHRDFVASKVKKNVLESTTGTSTISHCTSYLVYASDYLRMTVRKDESVPVNPLGVLGVEPHKSGEEHVGSRGHTLYATD